MRTFTIAAVLLAAIPSTGIAAPCVPATLAAYIGLGAGGCTVGGAMFASFTSDASPLATEIDPLLILVNPITGLPDRVGLSFQFSSAANSGVVIGNGIGYSVSGPPLVARELGLAGTRVTPDGVVTALQFAPDPLTVFDNGIDADFFETAPLLSLAFLDTFTEITLDGGLAGFVGSGVQVTENFVIQTVQVPEPASLTILGVGLAAAGWRRRRRKTAA